MRVLSICLDFFLDPIAPWAGRAEARLSNDLYRVWPPKYVRAFLEQRLGMRPEVRVPGKILELHAEPWEQWDTWIGEKKLRLPFDLVQVDAHANLGGGDEGWFYMLGTVAHLPPARRDEADLKRMTPENYLLFALARGWLASATLVTHPSWRNDIPPLLYRDGDPATGDLELRAYDPKVLERALEESPRDLPPAISADPPVPLRIAPGPEFQAEGGFDLVTVTRAPHYTCPNADILLPVLEEYLEPV